MPLDRWTFRSSGRPQTLSFKVEEDPPVMDYDRRALERATRGEVWIDLPAVWRRLRAVDWLRGLTWASLALGVGVILLGLLAGQSFFEAVALCALGSVWLGVAVAWAILRAALQAIRER